MEYILITAEDPDELSDQVNASLKEGWKPYGNVVILAYGYNLLLIFHRTKWYYAQAMIKEQS
jgi:hypothetical protein